MNIRKANADDLSRIAEIFIFNNRINYLPIFKDEYFSFGELQVVSFIENYLLNENVICHLYVFDTGIIKGFIQMDKSEICKLYVDPFFQNLGIGNELLNYAINDLHADFLWALEKNEKAISFYQKHGFHLTNVKKFEEGSKEYLVKLER